MDKLTKETTEYIQELLKAQLENRRENMITAIQLNYSEGSINNRIKEYQEVYKVYSEFDDWVEGVED